MSAKSVAKLYAQAAEQRRCTRCRTADAAAGMMSCRPCLDALNAARARMRAEGKAPKRKQEAERPGRRRRAGEERREPGRTPAWKSKWKGLGYEDMGFWTADNNLFAFFYFRRGLYDPARPAGKRWSGYMGYKNRSVTNAG